MQGLLQFVRTLGAARLAAMAAVGIALIGFFAFLILRVTAVPMTPLFTDLSFDDSAAIIKDLERQAIPYELKNDGAIILVPQDTVARLRMKLAEGGLPKGGGIGYEIFDKSDALGTTSFVQNINHLRALEGELARTIRSIDRVQAARVHLVMPERPLFARDKAEPSASIVLKVRGALEAQQVRAIRHLVASAVNGLKPQRVSIVDETGALLADGTVEDRQRRRRRQRRAPARLRAPAARADRIDRVLGRRSRAAPASRSPPISTSTASPRPPTASIPKAAWCGRARRARNSAGRATASRARSPSATNCRAPTQPPPQPTPQPRDQSKKSEEIVNYEISRTTKTEVIEGGRINRISVAVLVDGIYAKNDKGEQAYQERPKEQLDRIAALVRSAIGFDQKRGDQVEVVNLRFAEVPPNVINEPTGFMSFLQFTKDDIMRGIEMSVMAILGIVVVLLVVRPLVRRIVTPDEAAIVPALPRKRRRAGRRWPGRAACGSAGDGAGDGARA